MTKIFKQTVEALWQLAELDAPRFAEDGSASLVFDNVPLRLKESENEQELLVVADLGIMSSALIADADRLQQILGLGFAFLATHNVLVSLEGDQLIVSGSYPFGAQDIELLSDLLSDVVSAAQTLDQQTGDTVSGRNPNWASLDPNADTAIIFQP